MKKELEPYTSLKDKPDSLFQVLLKSFYLAFGIESPIRDALYRKIIFKDKFLGSVPVYLVVLNKLKTCAINAPLLLLSTGEKQKEFCRWLIDDAKGLTIEEQVTYRSYMIAYGVVEDEEVRKQMGRKVLRPS